MSSIHERCIEGFLIPRHLNVVATRSSLRCTGMRLFTSLVALNLLCFTHVSRTDLPVADGPQGLHFYFESSEKRCFLEELPSETIVEGACPPLTRSRPRPRPRRHRHRRLTAAGHYKAFLWSDESKSWAHEPELGIHVAVEELSSGHVVVNTRGPPEGKFTFTSHEPGDHSICLHSNRTGGWLTTEHVKMYLDIQVGAGVVLGSWRSRRRSARVAWTSRECARVPFPPPTATQPDPPLH